MKALALDTSLSCITIAAKNDLLLSSLSLDIGMRQSEKLLPAIDFVLRQVGVEAKDLDYSAICSGPGSFTGLRLGLSALKAFELCAGVPIYGINSLDCYAAPFTALPCAVLSVIDARKDKFYAKGFFGETELFPCDDYEIENIARLLENAIRAMNADGGAVGANGTIRASGSMGSDTIFVAGLDAPAFVKACEQKGLLKNCLVSANGKIVGIESLFLLAEEKIKKNEPPLKEYNGPIYFRASEAERNALAL